MLKTELHADILELIFQIFANYSARNLDFLASVLQENQNLESCLQIFCIQLTDMNC